MIYLIVAILSAIGFFFLLRNYFKTNKFYRWLFTFLCVFVTLAFVSMLNIVLCDTLTPTSTTYPVEPVLIENQYMLINNIPDIPKLITNESIEYLFSAEITEPKGQIIKEEIKFKGWLINRSQYKYKIFIPIPKTEG